MHPGTAVRRTPSGDFGNQGRPPKTFRGSGAGWPKPSRASLKDACEFVQMARPPVDRQMKMARLALAMAHVATASALAFAPQPRLGLRCPGIRACPRAAVRRARCAATADHVCPAGCAMLGMRQSNRSARVRSARSSSSVPACTARRLARACAGRGLSLRVPARTRATGTQRRGTRRKRRGNGPAICSSSSAGRGVHWYSARSNANRMLGPLMGPAPRGGPPTMAQSPSGLTLEKAQPVGEPMSSNKRAHALARAHAGGRSGLHLRACDVGVGLLLGGGQAPKLCEN